jgi:hypothetical protein
MAGIVSGSRLRVKLAALLGELAELFLKAALEGFFFAHALFGGVFADVWSDFCRDELWAARAADAPHPVHGHVDSLAPARSALRASECLAVSRPLKSPQRGEGGAQWRSVPDWQIAPTERSFETSAGQEVAGEADQAECGGGGTRWF